MYIVLFQYHQSHTAIHMRPHMFSDPHLVPMTYAQQAVPPSYGRPQDAGNLGRLKVTICQVSCSGGLILVIHCFQLGSAIMSQQNNNNNKVARHYLGSYCQEFSLFCYTCSWWQLHVHVWYSNLTRAHVPLTLYWVTSIKIISWHESMQTISVCMYQCTGV